MGAIAQQAVTTTGGTANAVPKFSGAATLVNSAITESSGKVGIGVGNPASALDVQGAIVQRSGAANNLSGYMSTDAGNVNSTTALNPGITVFNASSQYVFGADLGFNTRYRTRLFATSNGDVTLSYTGLSPTAQSSFTDGLVLRGDTGNVGIGTINPGARLEINGSVKLTSGSGASLTFADGTIQSTAWKGSLCGGDYAESVDVSGDRTRYEPGDVLVISDGDGSDVSKSTQSYSTLVAGIYSTKPGLVGRRQQAVKSDTEVPMAMVGVVPTKVSTENGSIKRGDLLVTSSTEGYAMKGTDHTRMLGAIVGKALGSLDSGTGVIEVLVSLQ